MRTGNHAFVFQDPSGRLVAFATGADATSEHEWGIDDMLLELTGLTLPSREDAARLLKSGELVEMPDVMATRRIVRGLDNLIYGEALVGNVLTGCLVYDIAVQLQPFGNTFIDAELRFKDFAGPRDLVGAWDSRSFGFKSRGEQPVALLREFAKALQAGNGIFAGTFLKTVGSERLTGLVIAREDLLQPEHRVAMKLAQDEYESDVRLYMQAKTSMLLSLAQKLKNGVHIFAITPLWHDGEVLYRCNTGRVGDDSGPFSFEELSAWFQAGAPGRLRRTAP